ncbi:unnamed protein product [Cunninghamella echinulata]
MKIFYLSSLLSIVAYVSAIDTCPEGGPSVGVYGPNAGDCDATCIVKGYNNAEKCFWEGNDTFCRCSVTGII